MLKKSGMFILLCTFPIYHSTASLHSYTLWSDIMKPSHSILVSSPAISISKQNIYKIFHFNSNYCYEIILRVTYGIRQERIMREKGLCAPAFVDFGDSNHS